MIMSRILPRLTCTGGQTGHEACQSRLSDDDWYSGDTAYLD